MGITLEDAPLESQPPCVPSQTHRCPPQTRFSLDFPTPVEHTTIILVSQAQDCGGDFDPALLLSSPTQTARIATLRTLSLQHVSPGLLCFQSLATEASFLHGLWGPGRHLHLFSFISSHQPLLLLFQERQYSIPPSSQFLLPFYFLFSLHGTLFPIGLVMLG